MMYQGVLDTFLFTVTEAEVCTFRDLSKSREQLFAEHKVIEGLPKLQRLGRALDSYELTVTVVPLTPLSTVAWRLSQLEKLIESTDPLPLVLGLKYLGLFVLKSAKISHRIIHNGVVLSAEVALSLTEYPDDVETGD